MPAVPKYRKHIISKNAADVLRRDNSAAARAAKTVQVQTEPVIPSNWMGSDTPGIPIRISAIAQNQDKLKVAYYARVSTTLESQEMSAESQQEHFEELIRSDPDMEFAGAFVDIGLTGTKAETRPELQRLLQECRDGKINVVLTKSISRFARSTTDLLEIVRTLKSYNVAVWFDKENLRTDSMESEFMMTLLASFAEDESHSISGNMKWSIRSRFRDGTYKQSIAPYGYEWNDGLLMVVPEKAEIVKRIFRMALSGSGMNTIARTLNEEDIPSPGGRKWSAGALRAVVTNPAYTGDMLYQKTFKDESFVQRKNKGELDQFLDSDHHEGIISREDFENAQAAIAQRAKEVGYREGSTNNRGNQRYPFTGILTCRACGSVMHRQTWNGDRPCWICHKHTSQPDQCSMKPQSEADLKRAFINCLNKLAWSQRKGYGILDLYEKSLGKTEAEKNAERLAEIDRELDENKREVRKLTAMVMRERFQPKHREKQAFLSTREKELLAEKNRILIGGVPEGTLQKLKGFVNSWKITDYEGAFPEDIFTEYIERCVVNTGRMVEFHFKCGLKLTESLYRAELI